MLFFYFGTDRNKARDALDIVLAKNSDPEVLRVTDAHTVADVQMVLQGPGMFASKRTVVFDSILGGNNEEMRQKLLDALKGLKGADELFYILEGALDAATRKQVEKFAESSEKFDAPKKEKDDSIFALANALQKGDRKALWVGLMREFSKGVAPEAVHGLLFWGAKQMLLRSHGSSEVGRAQRLVAGLAELPHEARRRGEDLEYSLERFALTKTRSES